MRFLSVVLVVALFAAVCVPALAQKNVSDDRIYDEVRRRLASDRDAKGGGLDVEVHEGVVTLRGKVRDAKQKARAEHVARKTKGVKKVVNELQVEMPQGAAK